MRRRFRIGPVILGNTIGNLVADGISRSGKPKAGSGKSANSTATNDGTQGSGNSSSTDNTDVQPGDIVVTAKSRSSKSAATFGIGGLSFNATQFAEWVRAANKSGGMRPSETNGQAPAAKPLNSNADVDKATQNKAADLSGIDTVDNPALHKFMLDVSKPLLDLRLKGGDREKFITIGMDSSGNYVVTSILAVGENGASFSPNALRNSAATRTLIWMLRINSLRMVTTLS